MADYAGEPVTILATNARDALGTPLNGTNASARMDVFSDDLAVQYVTDDVMVWSDVVSAFVGGWDTTGRLPAKYQAKVKVTPNGGLESWEWREIELADRPSPIGAGCGAPWFDPDQVEALKGLSEEDRDLVARAASRMMWAASGRQFSGICRETVRPPCANVLGAEGLAAGTRLSDGSLWLGDIGTSVLPEATFGGGGADGYAPRSLITPSTVTLPGFPIVDVEMISIDGTDLDPSEWLIVEDRSVIRTGNKSWPLWQRIDRPLGEAQTFGIRYTFGTAVPPEGTLAARVFGVEIGKSPAFLDDKSCRIPKRLQQITREGMTAVIIDPFQFLDKGGFGIYEVDTFINSTNPHHLSRDAKVLNPDLLGAQPLRIR